jgi:hypothetical protein
MVVYHSFKSIRFAPKNKKIIAFNNRQRFDEIYSKLATSKNKAGSGRFCVEKEEEVEIN